MESNIQQIIATIAATASAVAASAALAFSAHQNSQNAAAISFTIIQKFSDDCKKLFNDCRLSANNPEEFQNCVTEIITFFDVFALLINSHDINKRSREYIIETICDYIENMSKLNYDPYIVEITKPKLTCKELKNFIVQHKYRFSNPKSIATMLNIPISSVV